MMASSRSEIGWQKIINFLEGPKMQGKNRDKFMRHLRWINEAAGGKHTAALKSIRALIAATAQGAQGAIDAGHDEVEVDELRTFVHNSVNESDELGDFIHQHEDNETEKADRTDADFAAAVDGQYGHGGVDADDNSDDSTGDAYYD